ncbi:MAG TPA: flagellar biosynthesis protein FlhA [Planctomycetota bacterium]|nr:flagellar biosynthesis protein FlhA [Planctomycetota bacterium]
MPRWAEWIGRHRDILFVTAILAIMATIFVPLPPFVLDFLLTVSITMSILVLVTVIYIKEPIKFSVFPSVLLMTTAYRLALNIAATRQILGNAGSQGTGAAGRVIESFGNFVAGKEPVIGFVIFAILIIVNFVVITKGSGRISEVAARFTLDAMPGKQMAIDADLNAGLIREAEARARRQQIAREADFYGAMDGASKFVRGDAIAGIIITLINIVAGFIIGWLKFNMTASKSLYTFTILTIGDGLVSQIPALIVSLAAGLIVTRATSDANLGREFIGQIFSERKVLYIAMGFVGLLLMTAIFMGSGLPKFQLAVVGGALGVVAWVLGSAEKSKATVESAKKEKEAQAQKKPEKVEGLLHVDAMELEIGYGLIRLVDPAQGGGFLDRVTRIRRQMAVDLGLVVPPVRIRDNMQLEPNQYLMKIRGTTIAQGSLMPEQWLAMDSGAATGPVEGTKTKEPAFGLVAYWVVEGQKQRAEALGYTVVDAATVLATHLTEVVKQHAHELLTRDEVNNLIKTLKETSPSVVEEVVPAVLKPGEVQKVLQNLLKEGVSIRDLGTILETLGDYAPRSKDPEVLTEYVRNALARTICRQHVERDGKIYVITLDPKLEDLVKGAIERTDRGTFLALTPPMVSKISERVAKEVEKLVTAGHTPAILCSPQVRAQMKKIADTIQPGITVLSYNEIVRDVQVEALGMVAVEA